MNRSRRERQRLPAKPEFHMTWIVAGSFAGLALGFVGEIAWRLSALVMVAGGIVGVLLGAVVETARFWWGTRKFHRAHNPISHA
jgi:hypothetical protein